MGNVVVFQRRDEAAEEREIVRPNEIGALLSLVRATAHLLGRDRDSFCYDVNRFAGVEDLRYLPRADLARVVLFMQGLQAKAIGICDRALLDRP